MNEFKEKRKYLHSHPELSGKEKETSNFIKKELESLGVDKVHEEFSQHSLIAEINGTSEGKTVLFRCELDALPIQEANNFKYASKKDGISHKCGHDGHMAIMLSLAKELSNNKPEKGKFLILFQSAEETGQGAKSIIESGYLENFKIDHAIALHNVPGFPLSSIICKKGVFTPSVESLSIELTGETSHAGEPDKGKNPATSIARIIDFFNSLHQPDMKKSNYFVVAPVQIIMGEEAYGISAGKAFVRYTIRSTDYDFFNKQKEKISSEVNKIAKNADLDCQIEWLEAFSANNNDEKVVSEIKNSCSGLGLDYIDKPVPFDWGEDFGLFTQKYRGAMFGIGAGEDAHNLHDSRYDFPDEIIPDASKIFYELAKRFTA